MATLADLQARVRGLEARSGRAEEDITAIIDTVVRTHDKVETLTTDVTWVKQAVEALLDHHGISVPQPQQDQDPDDA
jgi:uncharacterized coiled-coil protein SlyX